MAAPAAIQQATPRDLNDDVVMEILLRLPPTLVLRCSAVCKAWQRITKSPSFVAAHRRRRPLELIFQRHGPSGALETIPAATLDQASGRRLHIQYPEQPARRANENFLSGYYALIASCDGLLLFERGGRRGKDFFVCDPRATRQWTKLPPLPGDKFTLPCGFYVHGPSGEHRVLCLSVDKQGRLEHYVCSLEAAEARRLGPAYPVHRLWDADQPFDFLNLHGKLHWLRHPPVLFATDDPSKVEKQDAYKILAFDTVSETFRRIRRPPPIRRGHGYYEAFLLEMSGGMLAMTAIADGNMDLWVMEDYSNDESWTHRLRVDLPWPLRHACWAINAGAEEGHDVILVGDSRRCWVGLYDVAEKRVLKQIQLADDRRVDSVPRVPTQLNAFVFRDSLERHAFFSPKSKYYTVSII